MVVSSGKQTLPFSLLACVITRANDQQGFQMLCVHFFLAGGFSSLKSTQNEFCIVWKPDLVWKCIISQVRKASPSKLWWLWFNGNLTNSTKKEAGSYLHEIYTFISEQRALMGFLQSATIAFFPPRPMLYQVRMSHLLPNALCALVVCREFQ